MMPTACSLIARRKTYPIANIHITIPAYFGLGLNSVLRSERLEVWYYFRSLTFLRVCER
jgi:hypothetical protein